MTGGVTESVVERAALEWLDAAGWRIALGPDVAPNALAAERRDYGDVMLGAAALRRAGAAERWAARRVLENAFRKLTPPYGAVESALQEAHQ